MNFPFKVFENGDLIAGFKDGMDAVSFVQTEKNSVPVEHQPEYAIVGG